MKKVIINIEVENTKLAELGVDQPIEYRQLNFNSDHFVGYWISKENIVFYVGTQTFNCKNCELNINKFEAILG